MIAAVRKKRSVDTITRRCQHGVFMIVGDVNTATHGICMGCGSKLPIPYRVGGEYLWRGGADKATTLSLLSPGEEPGR